MRRFESRQLLTEGWCTEWEPESRLGTARDQDARRIVRDLNVGAEARGERMQFRSVEIEDAFE